MGNTLNFKGRYHVEIFRKGELIESADFSNGITDEGKDNIIDVMFHGATQTDTWYIGLIDNSGFSALADGDTHDAFGLRFDRHFARNAVKHAALPGGGFAVGTGFVSR